MKNLTQRILVALWGIPLLLALAYFGGYFFLIFILVINAVALWEFYSMWRGKDIFPYRITGVLMGTLLILTSFYQQFILWPLIFLFIILVFFFHLQQQKGISSSTNSAFTVIGVFYISLFLTTLLLLRQEFESLVPGSFTADTYTGGKFIILTFISIWICDTAAYFGGKQLGRHKLAPAVSPNKTVEGAVFGFIFAIISFTVFGILVLPEIPLPYFLISGLIIGTFGQLGDLVESRFKRDAGVKDTSNILPGHGGFLDRFDSLIFVSPFLYFLLKFIKL